MKVQIIGLGVVGIAQAYLARSLWHDVYGYDIVKTKCSYCKVVDDYIIDADITFICTNETSVEEVIKELNEQKVDGIYVIKSTTLPRTTKCLSEKYGIHICHNPEFLREKTSIRDVMQPNMIIIGGCCEEHGKILDDFYSPLKVPIIHIDATASEMVKQMLNTYLPTPTLISF